MTQVVNSLNAEKLILILKKIEVYSILHLVQVAKYKDPRQACAAIAATSYKLWLRHDIRIDDITIIIVYINKGQP